MIQISALNSFLGADLKCLATVVGIQSVNATYSCVYSVSVQLLKGTIQVYSGISRTLTKVQGQLTKLSSFVVSHLSVELKRMVALGNRSSVR